MLNVGAVGFLEGLLLGLGDVEVDLEYLVDLYGKQKGRCALSGVRMTWVVGCARAIYVDRIDLNIGYVPGNVQLLLGCMGGMRGGFEDVDAVKSVLGELLERRFVNKFELGVVGSGVPRADAGGEFGAVVEGLARLVWSSLWGHGLRVVVTLDGENSRFDVCWFNNMSGEDDRLFVRFKGSSVCLDGGRLNDGAVFVANKEQCLLENPEVGDWLVGMVSRVFGLGEFEFEERAFGKAADAWW